MKVTTEAFFAEGNEDVSVKQRGSFPLHNIQHTHTGTVQHTQLQVPDLFMFS